MIHEKTVEFRVDFKSAVGNTNLPIAKKLIYLPYANLCKLGDFIVDMDFKDAGLPKDEICQVLFVWHK